MKNRIISIFLAIIMLLGMVVVPSPAYALSKDEGSTVYEKDLPLETIDGELYKAIDFEDVARKDTNTFKFFRTQFLRRLEGTYANGTPTKPNVEDYTVNVNVDKFFFKGDALGFDFILYVKDYGTGKIIGITDKITVTNKYKFKKTKYWDDSVNYNVRNWQVVYKPELQYDIRITKGPGGTLAGRDASFMVAPCATSIYKAEYFTTGNKVPTATAKRVGIYNVSLEVPLNKNNLDPDEYYSFAQPPNARGIAWYKGKKITISKYGGDTKESLEVSNDASAARVKMYIDDPNVANPNPTPADLTGLTRGPGKFEQEGTTYHYEVTGDYNNPHIFTFREELQVKFDPNGGKWTDAESGKEKEAKTFPIGHSMKLNEEWGDIAKVEAPAAGTITPPEVKQNNQTVENKFLGWNTDSKASTALSETDLNNLQFTEPETTFYAIYSQQNDGKAKVDYIDNATGKSITIGENQKIAGQTYPAEKEGAVNTAIPEKVFDKDSAPKILGYKFNRVELDPKNGKYTADGGNTIKIYYDKVADIVPGTDPETNKPNPTPDGYVTVKFEPGDHGTLTGETTFYVNPKAGKTNADITEPTIKANTGYKVADPKWKPKFETTTAIDKDATYTAQYTKVDDVVNGHDENGNVVPKPDGYKTVTFDLDGKGTTENETVFYVNPEKEVTLTAPTVTGKDGYTVKTGKDAWKPEFTGTATKYADDKTFVAQYTFDKDVVPQKPGEEKPVVPDSFVKVEFKKGDHGVISSEKTTIYWVDPEKEVDLTDKAPAVIADKDYKHIGWDKPLKAKFAEATEITAQYKKLVVPGPDQPTKPDPNNPNGPQIPDPAYVKVEFKPGDHGTFEKVGQLEQTTIFWVYNGEKVKFNPPTVTEKENYKFTGWDKEVKDSFTANETYTATYKEKVLTEEPKDKKDYAEVEFVAGENGKFEQIDVVVEGGQTQKKDQTTKFWVLKNEKVTFNVPQVTPKEGYSFTGWKEPVKETYTVDTVHTAQYSNSISDKKIEGWTELTFDQGVHGKLANGAKNVKWVDPNVALKLSDIAPGIVADTNYSFKTWTKPGQDANVDPVEVALESVAKYDKPVTFTATYKANVIDDEKDIPGNEKDNFVKITFDKGKHGKFVNTDGTTITTEVSTNVRKSTEVDLTEKAPKVLPDSGYGHTGWKIDQDVINLAKVKVDKASTIIATYIKGEFDEDNINDILVLGPKKAAYAEGDPLDLTGLTILAIDKNGIRNEYTVQDKALKDGNKKELTGATLKVGETTIDLANLPKLTHKDHNDKPITLTKGNITRESKVHLTVSMTKTDQPTDLVAANQGENPTDTKIKGKAQKGDTVKIYIPGQDQPIKEVEVTNEDGTFETSVSKENKPYDVGTKFNVTATAEDKAESSPQEVKVIKDVNGDWKDDGEGQRTPMPTNLKALNIKEDKFTTITGKAKKDDIIKVYDDQGKEITTEETRVTVTEEDGSFTIKLAKKDGQEDKPYPENTVFTLTATAKEKLESEKAPVVVKVDKDGNRKPDNEEDFDIKKVTKVEVMQDPIKMDYLVKSDKNEDKVPFETAGLVIKLTDSTGKEVKYTAEELKGMDGIKIEPADQEKIGLDKNNTKLKVTVTGSEQTEKPSAESKNNITVKLDADGNSVADEKETTATPTVKARNIGKDPKVTTVEGKAPKGSTVTIKYTPAAEEGQTAKEVTKTVTAEENGTYKLEIEPKLDAGTEVKVTAKDGEKKVSPEVKTQVFEDKDNDGKDDKSQNFDITKADKIEMVYDPAKMDYLVTKEDGKVKLETKGMVVKVTDKAGVEKKFTAEEIAKDTTNFTVEPANGAEIGLSDNDKPIKVTLNVKGATTNEVTTSRNLSVKLDADKSGTADVDETTVIKSVVARNIGTGEPKVKATFTTIEGEAEKGSTVTITFTEKGKSEATTKTVKASDDGKYKLELNSPTILLEEDTVVKAKAQFGKKKPSIEIETKVFEDLNADRVDDKTQRTPKPTIVFAANQNTVGSTGQATQTAKQKTTVKFTVVNKPTTVYVKYTDNGVAKEETFEIGANDEATKTVDLQVKLPVGAEVKVLAKDADKLLSEPATATVVRDANNDGTADDKTPLKKPVIDDIKAGANNVLVTPPEGATELVISETDKDGNTPEGSTPITLTKDAEGNWKNGNTTIKENGGKLTIPKGNFKLDEYNVVKAEAKGDPDTTTPSIGTKTVGKAADETAPAKPKVDPAVQDDTDVRVKTPVEPDAKTITVEITKPGKTPTKVIVEKDGDKWKTSDGKEVPEENGKLVVPVTSKLDKDDTVKVTVTDDSNNTSDPDEQKVGEKLQLPKPTINQIKDGEKIVAGKAEKAETVDIYKQNAQGGFDKVATDVGVGPDGSYTYNNPDGFKDGDVIKVVSKKPGMYDNEETATVGVDKSKLIDAINEGKKKLEGKDPKDYTPADRKLKEAIEEGQKVVDDPNATQDDVTKATDKINDAIKEKEETDKALKELEEAKKELDKTIEDAEKDEKPDEAIEKGQEASDTAGGVIDKKGKDADGKDMTAEQIKKLVEKTKEENRLLRLPVIQVTINTAVNNGNSIVFTTNPGRCKVTITILRSNGNKETYETTTDPTGTGSLTIAKELKSEDSIIVSATRITKDRPIPDYLDNYTSTGV